MTNNTDKPTPLGKPGLFTLGKLLSTPGVLREIPMTEIGAALARHNEGDWGDCCPDDWQSNEEALKDGWRLFSVYHSHRGVQFWIITEADRSATTVLLPSEY